MLPPDSNEEFDVHLQSAVRELKKIRLGLVTDIVIIYCLDDEPTNDAEKNDVITALRIKKELENSGFSV